MVIEFYKGLRERERERERRAVWLVREQGGNNAADSFTGSDIATISPPTISWP